MNGKPIKRMVLKRMTLGQLTYLQYNGDPKTATRAEREIRKRFLFVTRNLEIERSIERTKNFVKEETALNR